MIDIRSGEWEALVWSIAFFFLVLFGYALLKPIRDQLAVGRDDATQVRLFTGTIVAMLVANPLYTLLMSWLPRRWFVPLTYQFFALNLLIFAVIWTKDPASRPANFDMAFYVWVSVYNLFINAVFWSVMADLWNTQQSKRLFALIGIGGTLGFIAGSATVGSLSQHIDVRWFFGASILCLQLIGLCLWRLASIGGLLSRSSERSAVRANRREPGKRSFRALLFTLTRPYLLAVSGYVLLLSVTNTVLWHQRNRIIADHVAEPDAQRSVLAWIEFSQQSLTLFVQCFVSAWIIRRIGVGFALAVLPLITLVGCGVLALTMDHYAGTAPTFIFWCFVILWVLRNGLQHALSRPTREILFTGVSQEERYASKAFVDTVVYRAGDFGSIHAIARLNKSLAAAPAPDAQEPAPENAAVKLLAIAVPLAAIWVALSFYLGRWQRRRQEELLIVEQAEVPESSRGKPTP